jgi:hypothetical protein
MLASSFSYLTNRRNMTIDLRRASVDISNRVARPAAYKSASGRGELGEAHRRPEIQQRRAGKL